MVFVVGINGSCFTTPGYCHLALWLSRPKDILPLVGLAVRLARELLAAAANRDTRVRKDKISSPATDHVLTRRHGGLAVGHRP